MTLILGRYLPNLLKLGLNLGQLEPPTQNIEGRVIPQNKDYVASISPSDVEEGGITGESLLNVLLAENEEIQLEEVSEEPRPSTSTDGAEPVDPVVPKLDLPD